MRRLDWICFCSQTGSEIVNICKELKIIPIVVVTNNRKKLSDTSITFFKANNIIIIDLPFNPTEINYRVLNRLKSNLYTLHGYLRIIPKSYIRNKKDKFYNGHPGLITKYPELKGKDPQQKAFELQMIEVGSVIHRITPEVDEGEILVESGSRVSDPTNLNEYYDMLKETSLVAWKTFFRNYIL
jgi:phosphoribosylglycinamide formyltransferase-1